jgi:hypothetical protein
LKARIIDTYQLSEYEKFNMLVKMEPIGNRKPSKLLAALMELCPTGVEKTLPFHYCFTQCLPAPSLGAFGLRAAPKVDSAISSTELIFGAPLTLPDEVLEHPEFTTQALTQWAW